MTRGSPYSRRSIWIWPRATAAASSGPSLKLNDVNYWEDAILSWPERELPDAPPCDRLPRCDAASVGMPLVPGAAPARLRSGGVLAGRPAAGRLAKRRRRLAAPG